MAKLIQKTDTLNQGREKLNTAITDAEKAKDDAGQAVITSNQANQTSQAAKNEAAAALQYTVGKYLEPVDTFSVISTTYPDATENDRVFVRDTGKVYILQNGSWQEFSEITAGPVNEVDQRLTAQLDDNVQDLIKRGVNILSAGAVGDGITDDTAEIKRIISQNNIIVIPIPPVYYKITDEIVIGSSKTIIFIGGNTWNPSVNKDVWFKYEGEENIGKAMIRVSDSPVGVEPSVARSNIKFYGGVTLDGNNKIGHAFYSAYVVNDSSFDAITVTNTLADGVRIEKSWYASYSKLVARNTQGPGITIGKNESWGGVNGVEFRSLRASSCGLNGEFDEGNPTAGGYGIGFFPGSGTKLLNVTSESNYGPGVVYGIGNRPVNEIDTIYTEGNCIKAKNDGKASRNWGFVLVGSASGRGNSVRNLYLYGVVNDPAAQSLLLTGQEPVAPVEFYNVAYGHHLKAEWSNYKILGYAYDGLTQYIEGHLPKNEVLLSSLITTVYVRSTGNDKNDGRTNISAVKTLKRALEIARFAPNINTIDCAGTIDIESIDFRSINKPIVIDGKTTGKIINSINGQALEIKNAAHSVKFKDFTKISRLLFNDCAQVIFENAPTGHEDVSPNATISAYNTQLFVNNSPLSGSQSTGSTKNGIRLHNSNLNVKNSPITDYSSGRFVRMNEGSTITANSVWVTPGDIFWEDGSGYIVGGNRMINSFGTVQFT